MEFQQLTFWLVFTTIIIGIFVHVISHYGLRLVDSIGPLLWRAGRLWLKRYEKRVIEWRRSTLHSLIDNEYEQLMASVETVKWYLTALLSGSAIMWFVFLNLLQSQKPTEEGIGRILLVVSRGVGALIAGWFTVKLGKAALWVKEYQLVIDDAREKTRERARKRILKAKSDPGPPVTGAGE